MAVLLYIAAILGALAIPVALLDRWLTLRARGRRRDAVDDALSELLTACARDDAGTRTARR